MDITSRARWHKRSFSRVTVLAGSQVNGKRRIISGTEMDYCWAPVNESADSHFVTREAFASRSGLVQSGASVFGKSPWMNVSGWLTPMFARRSGIPTVVTLHELVELADLRALKAPGGPFAYGARVC
jgi:hypothetical protein